MKRLFYLVTALFLTQGAFAQQPPPPGVTDVWIVVKSHFDLGFTDLAENVFQRYRAEMMDKALNVIDQNRDLPASRRFVWTVPGWPLEAQMLGPQQDPQRRLLVEKAVKEGFIATHALAFTTHTESQDLGDLVRGLTFAANINRKYNRPIPIAAKMTDVPSHSWVMPVLLHHAGVKFLHIGVNPASQYPRVPQLFWWEGPDGSRVLCGYTIDYGSSLLPPKDWPCRNYLSMIMAGDNHGPPAPSEVDKWRKVYEEKMPGVRVHFGTLDDFAAAVLAEKPQLPVVRGDMPDTWIHGLMAMPQASKAARNLRPLEPALESFDTQLRNWGLQPGDLRDSLDKAYEQSLLYSEHTWGMNAEYGPRRLYGNEWKQWLAELEKEPMPENGDYAKLPRGSKRKWMQSYQDHRNYAGNAARIVNREMESRMALLAASVKSDGKSVVVYNGLPWKRSGMVTVDGNEIWVTEVPAMGYKTIPYKQAASRAGKTGNRIETPYFIATFDLEKGGISSLIDKSTGKEMVDPKSGYALGQFLHERFSSHEVYDRFFNKYSRIKDGWGLNDIGKPGMPDSSQVPYLATTPAGWTITHRQTNAEDRVVLTAGDSKGLAKGYTIQFVFPRNSAWVDVEWEVSEKTADKHPEGGWLCFPLNIPQPEFVVGRPGAPINPAADIIPGTNRHLMAVTSGVSIRGNGGGAALCPIDAPLVSLGEPGLWRFSMDAVPEKPYVFVNLYNNMWNTNFPLWQDGSWSEKVRIWPVGKNERLEEDLAIRSWEARLPLQAAVAGKQNGVLPATKTGLAVSRKGTLVTAFGPDPNGHAGTVLTLWEQAGTSGKISVSLPDGKRWSKAVRVDLRGEKLPGDAITITDGKFSFDLNKYAPASFLLE